MTLEGALDPRHSPRTWVDDLERELTGISRRTEDDPRWDTPGTLAKALNPGTVQTPALDLIDQELAKLADTPDARLIITMPPQEGKSQRVAHDFPVWWLKHRPWTRIVIGSYQQRLAERNGRMIRNSITETPDLDLTIAPDNGSASEWQLRGQLGGVYSVGIGGGLTGRACDLMIVDDPIKNQKEADSETFRENVWDWWQTVASSRMSPGGQVVVILTRWHQDDLAGRLLADPGSTWRVLNIPAEADHDPDEGETDVLGRAPGEFLDSAQGRSLLQWEMRKREAGSRGWQSLYQGRPTKAGGTMLRAKWWQEYETPLWLDRPDGTRVVTGFDDLLVSWDMAFKGAEDSDFVVGQVWGRRGVDSYLLDQVRAQLDFPATCKAVRQLNARWPQAWINVVEDKANGTAVLASLRHVIPGLVPEEPQGGKEARVAAVSPLVESGNVFLPSPELAPWVGDFIEEASAFPTGAHDDQVDAMSQALNRLILQPLLAGQDLGAGGVVTAEDLDPDLQGFGGYIP